MNLPDKTFLPFKRFVTGLVLATGLSLGVNQGPSQSQNADPIVVMQTTKGTMAIRVYANMVPNTARNFLDLVSRGFYDGKSFHRIETWCIQGGDPNGNGTGNYVDPGSGRVRYVPLEINHSLHHSAAGVVAMARGDNLNSASCQFYIMKSAMPQLDGQYAIFGGVVKGLNTIYGIGRGDRIIHAEILNGNGGQGSSSSSSSGSQPSQTGGGPTGSGQSGF
jgi:peptidyl-prolyl cis-trans isomerase B (cyclophilin B)